MSSKSTIFLTKDNEHCYEETNEPYYDDYPNGFKGYAILLEMSKKNIDIIWNDDDDIGIKIAPGSDLYKLIKSIKQV